MDGNIWVCVDCYFAHHYGVTITATTIRYYAGESDVPTDRLPLGKCDGLQLYDNTCSNHEVDDVYDDDGDPTGDTTECPHCGRNGDENGIQEFSWSQCDGCGSTLGGSRYRLAYEITEDSA